MRRTRSELLAEDLVAGPAMGASLVEGPAEGAWALPQPRQSPWTGSVSWGGAGPEVRGLSCATTPDDQRVVELVAEEIRWESVSLEHPLCGPVGLPLDVEHHLGQVRLEGPPARIGPRSPLWPAEVRPGAGWLGLYGYEWRRDRWAPWPERTRRMFLADEPISWPRLGGRAQRAGPEGVAAWSAPSPRVLVGVGFAVCLPDLRFEPFSVARAARFFPYVFVRCSDPLARLRARIRLSRGERATCGGGHGAIRPFLATDRDDVDLPGLRPWWDQTFAWYDADPAPRRFTAVRRGTDLVVNDPADRQEWRDGARHPSPSARGPRQGAFDSLHLAPRMRSGEQEEIMAPICAHSCLHVHWRWGARMGRTVLKPAPFTTPTWLAGWEDGRPFARQGAPLVPESQEVHIELVDSRTFVYDVDQQGAEPDEAHLLWHYGAAFIVGLQGFADFVALPDDAEGWAGFYHSLRYTDGPDEVERLVFPNGVKALSGEA